MPNRTIDLQVRPEHVALQQRIGASFRGFFLERVLVGSGIAYDYDWVGTRNYLAIHDIEVEESEIRVGGGAAAPVTDLRGRATFAPRGCPLAGWASTRKRVNAFASITFDPDVVEREFERNIAQIDAPMIHFRDPRIEATMWKLDAALKNFDEQDATYLETLALTAVLELEQLARGHAPAPESGRLSAASERRVRDFINDRMSSNITLADMADVAGLSRFHFSRAFKATFGLSPRDYLLWTRVEAAKRLLTETRHPIAEVAARVGFENPDRLSASFKRFAAVTPREYRRGAV